MNVAGKLILSFCFFALVSCAGTEKKETVKDLSSVENTETVAAADSVADTTKVTAEETPAENVAVETNRKKHFLWKVSDDDSHVWIMGTIHVADSSFYPMDSAIIKAFAASEEVATELDVSDASINAEISKRTMQTGLLSNGKTLKEILSKENYDRLDSVCNAWDIPTAGISVLRPWLATLTLSVVEIARLGYDAKYGIDLNMAAAAKQLKKKVVSIESVDDQMNALSFPFENESADSVGYLNLETALLSLAETEAVIQGMAIAWKTGNDSLMAALIEKEDSSCYAGQDCEKLEKYVAVQNQLLYRKRNKKMAEFAVDCLKNNRKTFMMVGSAHLVGKNENVISLLESKGYKIERF